MLFFKDTSFKGSNKVYLFCTGNKNLTSRQKIMNIKQKIKLFADFLYLITKRSLKLKFFSELDGNTIFMF